MSVDYYKVLILYLSYIIFHLHICVDYFMYYFVESDYEL